jgi:RNA polymerase sigma-70 factor (ECF subfamily)
VCAPTIGVGIVACVRGQPSPTWASDDQRCVRAFTEHQEYVCRALARHGVPSADIDDLAQEVFLVLWRRWRDYDAERPVRPWLAGIASNVARAHLRRSGRETAFGTIECLTPEPSSEDQLAGRRVANVVAGVLASLPERHRKLLVMHDVDEVPVREIASQLGVPVFTIYTRLRRARRALAEGLERRRSVVPYTPSANRRWIITACATAGAAAVLLLWQLVCPVRPPATHPLPRGVIGYWRFDERPGSTAALDLSAGGNPCALRGLDPGRAWTTGPRGGALALTGQGWLECSRPAPFAALKEELTLSVWVKAPPAPGLHALVSRQLDDGRLDRFYLGIDGGRQVVVFSSHLWKGIIRYPVPSQAWSRWVHLTAVHSAGESRLYIDGREVMRRRTTRGSMGGGTNPLIVGGAINGPSGSEAEERLEGVLGELVIYDRALSSAEVAALADRAPPR